MQMQEFWCEMSLSLNIRIKFSYTKCSCFLGEIPTLRLSHLSLQVCEDPCMQKLCNTAAMHDLSL